MPRGELATYRKKRSAEGTPEPIGRAGEERPGAFVVQQHDARRRHWDLRLEIGGVLHSWAVPKGPSLAPADKRLAVETEDHPVEYYDFEGVIPEGNYGAGAMIVWDRGLAVHRLDPEAGLSAGKLEFELRGYKLRGLWTLVRTARSREEWLLVKKPDQWATGETVEELSDRSVLSGLTTGELAEGGGRAAEVRVRLAELGAPEAEVDPAAVEPMLAVPNGEPFTDPGWLFELKYDGYRVLASADRRSGAAGGGLRAEVALRYRSGRDATATYPDLVRALGSLPYRSLLIDGEVVALDEGGRPSFQLLQGRAQLSRRSDVERAAVRQPVTYYAFDLIAFEGYDLRPLPLAERKELLRRLLPPAGPVRFADHVVERGEDLYAAVRERGLEGLVAKRADSPYRAGRSPAWVKIRADSSGEFAVVGFTAPQGGRAGFGALHLAVREGEGWRYIGRAGSGFTDAQLRAIHRRLLPNVRETPPATGPLPEGAEHTWVEPELVAEVRYTEVTDEGLLRHPVFERLREDRRPEDCTWESAGPLPEEPPEAPPEAAPEPEPEPEPAGAAKARPAVEISRPEKVFWPAEGYTKGDLVAYYRAVAPRMLPFLRDRPLVMTRYPDGIEGKSFYQKNAPDFTPEWIRTEPVWSEGSDKETRYLVCDTEEALLWIANLGAILLHLWSSRVDSLQTPDWCILDLDAKDAEFAHVVAVARAIHELAGEIGLPAAVKTSGGSGLHVLFPLGRQVSHQQSKQLAELIARVVAGRLRDVASVARRPAARRGKVYIDYLQNGWDKLLVAPYTARPTPGAPVSTPLEWDEVREGLDPAAFTIVTAPERFASEESDPLSVVLEAKPDLVTALAKLAERV